MKQRISAFGDIVLAGGINKAWAAAIAAPIADWLAGIMAEALSRGAGIAVPEAVHGALVSLAVGLAVYRVPNLPIAGATSGPVPAAAPSMSRCDGI